MYMHEVYICTMYVYMYVFMTHLNQIEYICVYVCMYVCMYVSTYILVNSAVIAALPIL